jgi:hypothetical protein
VRGYTPRLVLWCPLLLGFTAVGRERLSASGISVLSPPNCLLCRTNRCAVTQNSTGAGNTSLRALPLAVFYPDASPLLQYSLVRSCSTVLCVPAVQSRAFLQYSLVRSCSTVLGSSPADLSMCCFCVGPKHMLVDQPTQHFPAISHCMGVQRAPSHHIALPYCSAK